MHEHTGGRAAAPERQPLGHGRHAEGGRARFERRPGDVRRAVPVAVRLHDGPQLGSVERAEQGARVAPHRAEVERHLRERAISRARPGSRRRCRPRSSPTWRPKLRAARPCTVAAAAAASWGSSPLARNAAMIPVSTSPVPAVASAGAPLTRIEHALARGGDDRVGALEQHDRAERLGAAPRRPRAGARRPRPTPRRAAAPAPRVRGQHRRARPADRRQLVAARRRPGRAGGRPARAARRTSSFASAPPEPWADRERPHASRRRRRRRPERPLDGLQQPGLDDRQRALGHGDGDVPRVGAQCRARGEAHRAREPGRAADDEHRARAYLLSSGRLRGTSARISRLTSRGSVCAGSSPMSATTTSPAWNSPGATARPTLGPWKVTVSSAWTAGPATSPVEASTPDGTSTRRPARPPR